MKNCKIWTGCKTPGGYGRTKKGYAHRIAYVLYYGWIQDKLNVLHTCDNPPCVNPEHLWQGTQSENMKDCVKKGRFGYPSKGVQSANAKLTEDQVIDIRRKELKQKEYSKKYGIAHSTVVAIQQRKSYGSIA